MVHCPNPSIPRCTDRCSDDTSVAVLEKIEVPDGDIRSTNYEGAAAVLHFHKTITADNTAHKGIHPIEALDSHRSNLADLVHEALGHLPPQSAGRIKKSSESLVLDHSSQRQKPDLVSVTRGPGMRSNLSVGLDTAKGLAVAWQVPLMAVHHMQAHALTPRLAWALQMGTMTPRQDPPEPNFPFLSLLVSGGHTLLLHSTTLTGHEVLASTADIAIGEALDKIGRIVLPKERLSEIKDTAFAKHLSDYAFPSADTYAEYRLGRKRQDEIEKHPNEYGWAIQNPLSNTTELTYSFSGIASRVQVLLKQRESAVEGGISAHERLLFARTALGVAFEHLACRTIMAIAKLDRGDLGVKSLVVSGGVAANPFLRYVLREMLNARSYGPERIGLISPPADLCTDNAAMIGWCGIEMYEKGWRSSLSSWPLRKWSMDSDVDGTDGILAVPGWFQLTDTVPKSAAVNLNTQRGAPC